MTAPASEAAGLREIIRHLRDRAEQAEAALAGSRAKMCAELEQDFRGRIRTRVGGGLFDGVMDSVQAWLEERVKFELDQATVPDPVRPWKLALPSELGVTAQGVDAFRRRLFQIEEVRIGGWACGQALAAAYAVDHPKNSQPQPDGSGG